MTKTIAERSLQWTRVTVAALCLIGVAGLEAADKPATEETSGLKIGFVNFRKIVEESKIGKQQQASFEGLQNQMEASLLEMQKSLNEITAKLSDEDYLDGLSPEAENELKHKYRTLSQELQRTQTQYVQTLQEANMKVMQMISNEVAKAAEEVAQSRHLDLIVNEEASFFHKPSMDISPLVIAQMDAKLEKEQKGTPAEVPPNPNTRVPNSKVGEKKGADTPPPAPATNAKNKGK